MSNDSTNISLSPINPLEDIIHIRPIYQICIILTTMFTTITTMFAMFVIWRRSTLEMDNYKLFLINILATSFFLQLLIFFWQPLPIFTILGGANIGYLRVFQIPDFILNYICLDIFIGLVINLLLAYFNFLLYQCLVMKVGPLPKIFSTKKACVSYYFMSFLSIFIVTIVPLSCAYTNEEDFSKNVIEKFPFLQPIFGYEHFFGFNISDAKFLSIFIYILIGILLVYFFSGFLLNYLAIIGIFQLKSMLTVKIYRLQRTLYICVMLQTIFSFVFFFAPPIFVFVVNLVDDNVILTRGMISVIIISFHGPCCSLIMIFSIRPYRNYARSILEKYFMCKKLIKVVHTHTHTTNTWMM